MNRKKLFIRFALLIFFIFVFNALALWLHWYSALLWLDIPMHFLGGFWLSLVFIWLFTLKEREISETLLDKRNFKLITQVLFGVLIVGIMWEIFEILVNKSITKNPFDVLDTFSDIVLDLLGGLFALFYFLKRIMYKKENLV